LVSELARRLSDDVVTFSTEGLMVHITCGRSKFNLLGIDPEDFTELPNVSYEQELSMEQGKLKSMISETLFAVSSSTQDNRPIHTGSLFEIEEKTLTMVSLDGYRLALRREEILHKKSQENFSFVVPGAALSEVEKICGDTDDFAVITQGPLHVMFQIGETVLITRRLEGEFLNYKQSIPRQNSISVVGETRSLIASIERASLILSDKLKNPLHCIFGHNVLDITSKAAIGDAADECPIEGDGGELEIGFDNRYLSDALKAAPADKVRLELNSSVSPCVILPTEGEERFLYLVLPVRL
ncbi:MAG: DNA polymerase III subunit beta, partial [Pseudoflavonifractor sp.]